MDAQQYGFRGDRSDVDGIQDAPAGTGGFGDAFGSSLSMILVSELGDETFIIAAIMAMRHPRAIVFTGAIGALAVMTVLSTALGLIVPNLISQDVVNKAAFVLYTFFGAGCSTSPTAPTRARRCKTRCRRWRRNSAARGTPRSP